METYLTIQEIIDKVSLNARSNLKKHQSNRAIKNDLELIDLEVQASSENSSKKLRCFLNLTDGKNQE